jgi:hypothetical protein
MLEISVQTWKVWLLRALCSGSSDVIAAEMEEVVDLIMG